MRRAHLCYSKGHYESEGLGALRSVRGAAHGAGSVPLHASCRAAGSHPFSRSPTRLSRAGCASSDLFCASRSATRSRNGISPRRSRGGARPPFCKLIHFSRTAREGKEGVIVAPLWAIIDAGADTCALLPSTTSGRPTGSTRAWSAFRGCIPSRRLRHYVRDDPLPERQRVPDLLWFGCQPRAVSPRSR